MLGKRPRVFEEKELIFGAGERKLVAFIGNACEVQVSRNPTDKKKMVV